MQNGRKRKALEELDNARSAALLRNLACLLAPLSPYPLIARPPITNEVIQRAIRAKNRYLS